MCGRILSSKFQEASKIDDSGTIQVEIETVKKDGGLTLTKAALTRTARLLMDGYVYVPGR